MHHDHEIHQPAMFRPDIAGLRAFAVLSVVLFHAGIGWLPGGFVGVDIFFVISGYLITLIILRDFQSATFSVLEFYGRRIKRIVPAFITVLLVSWIGGWFYLYPISFRDLGRFQNISSFFYLNFMLTGDGDYFDKASHFKPLLHLWSLSVEEQFYAFWPLALLILARAKRILPVCIGLLFCVSLSYGLNKTINDPTMAYYLPWGRFWELMLGGWVAAVELTYPAFFAVSSKQSGILRTGIGLLLMGGAVAFITQDQSFPGWRALFPTLGCAIILATPSTTLANQVLGNRPAQFIGKISYPLYLWHWPILAFAHISSGEEIEWPSMIALLALSFLLAVATTVYVEKLADHAYRLKRRVTSVSLFIALMMTGVLGILTHDWNGFPNRYPSEISKILNFPESAPSPAVSIGSAETVVMQPQTIDCVYTFRSSVDTVEWHQRNIADFYDTKACFKITRPELPIIAVIGDSHAGHLLAGLSAEFGSIANIIRFDTFYCVPLIENVIPHNGAAGTNRCAAYNEFVFAKLRELKPNLVLVGSYIWQYEMERDWKYPNYVGDLIENSQRLIGDGVGAVIIAGEVPTWSPSIQEVIAREVETGKMPEVFSMNGINPKVLTFDVLLKDRDWGKRVTYVSVIDQLCNSKGCRRLKGPLIPEDLMAVDYGHYSDGASRFVVKTILGPVISEAIK